MKALTYNVHGWLAVDGAPNVALVREVIAASGAELVALNEVFHPYSLHGDIVLTALAEQLGMYHAFAPVMTAGSAPEHPPYGNAFLSRWPITAYASHHLTPMTAHGKRGLLEVRIRMPASSPFTVYVTHLDHRSEAVRLEQWAAAVTWLGRDRHRPHLLLGDFNALAETDYPDPAARSALWEAHDQRGWAEPRFDLIRRITKAGYVDAFPCVGQGNGATWPSTGPERRVDYVFLSRNLEGAARTCRCCDEPPASTASDHLPVLLELD